MVPAWTNARDRRTRCGRVRIALVALGIASARAGEANERARRWSSGLNALGGGAGRIVATSRRTPCIGSRCSGSELSCGVEIFFTSCCIALGKLLWTCVHASNSIAAGGVGIVGYYSRIPLVDYLGLLTEDVAHSDAGEMEGVVLLPGHQRSNADYVFSRKPEYILIAKESSVGLALPATREILEHPDLHTHYVWKPPPLSGYWRRGVKWDFDPAE